MSKKVYAMLFCLIIILISQNTYADTKAEQLLKSVAAVMKESGSLIGSYEIQRRHLAPFEEIREAGEFQLLRPNYIKIRGWNLFPSKETGKWEKTSEAAAYISNGDIFYTLFKNQETVSYRQAKIDANGKGILVNLQPVEDFFDENSSFYNLLIEARHKKTLVSISYTGDKTWENSTYSVIELVTNDVEKGFSRRRTMQFYIGDDKRIHRLINTVKWGELHTETETILRNISAGTRIKSADFAYTLPADAKIYAAPLPPLANGMEAPDLTLIDNNGNLVKLNDFRGQTVILDFWATWCVPCLKSFSHTAGTLRKLKDTKIKVLAINIWDSNQNALSWPSKHPELNSILFVTDITGTDTKASTKLFHVESLPLQYIISPNGKIVSSFQGFIGPTNELEEAIKAAENF